MLRARLASSVSVAVPAEHRLAFRLAPPLKSLNEEQLAYVKLGNTNSAEMDSFTAVRRR